MRCWTPRCTWGEHRRSSLLRWIGRRRWVMDRARRVSCPIIMGRIHWCRSSSGGMSLCFWIFLDGGWGFWGLCRFGLFLLRVCVACSKGNTISYLFIAIIIRWGWRSNLWAILLHYLCCILIYPRLIIYPSNFWTKTIISTKAETSHQTRII